MYTKEIKFRLKPPHVFLKADKTPHAQKYNVDKTPHTDFKIRTKPPIMFFGFPYDMTEN